MRPQHLRLSLLGSAIRLTKFVLVALFGLVNIIVFSQAFIAAVDYHNSMSPWVTPGRIALVSIGPVEWCSP